MLWQYLLTALSAILFFGFVIIGVRKFGLLSCYSAYAAKWAPQRESQLNPWQLVTIVSAFLLVPVLLEGAEGSIYQCFGFLAPAFLTMVGASPKYETDRFQWWIHQIGAWGTVLFVVCYSIIFGLWWLILIVFLIGMVIAWKTGFKEYWMFWGEMAMYLGTYILIFTIIAK